MGGGEGEGWLVVLPTEMPVMQEEQVKKKNPELCFGRAEVVPRLEVSQAAGVVVCSCGRRTECRGEC